MTTEEENDPRDVIRALALALVVSAQANMRFSLSELQQFATEQGLALGDDAIEQLVHAFALEITALDDDVANLHACLEDDENVQLWQAAAQERERIRDLLAEACSELDDTGGEYAARVAADLRRRGDIEQQANTKHTTEAS